MATRSTRPVPGGLKLVAPSGPDGRVAAVGPRERVQGTFATHHVFRRVTQLGFAAFIAFVTIQHVAGGETGTTASPEAFCPFGGVESLYRYVTSGGQFVPHTHLSNVVVLVALLLTTFLVRNAFCGWICPLGLLQEVVSSLGAFLQMRISPVRSTVRTIRGRGARLAAIDRPLRLLKYGVLLWAVGGAAVYGKMVFRDYDPWAALLNVAELSLIPGLVVLAVTLVASLFVERPWCRYACPLGAVTGMVGRLSPIYLKREPSVCRSCALCTRSCPMGLPVDSADTIESPDCIGCLECVGSCPRRGALDLRLGIPLAGK